MRIYVRQRFQGFSAPLMVKAFIRKHKPRSPEALDNVVAQALDSVSLNDILGWFSESETRTLID
jgi:hypothetical protein